MVHVISATVQETLLESGLSSRLLTDGWDEEYWRYAAVYVKDCSASFRTLIACSLLGRVISGIFPLREASSRTIHWAVS